MKCGLARALAAACACACLLTLPSCGAKARASGESVLPSSAPVASSTRTPSTATLTRAPTLEEARAFVGEVEEHLRKLWTFRDRANWINENFITDDTEALAATGEQQTAAYVRDAIKRSQRYRTLGKLLPPDVARKLYLLSISQTVPVPADSGTSEELAEIETWMTSVYGKGKYCPPAGSPLLKYLPPSAQSSSPQSGLSPGAPAPNAPTGQPPSSRAPVAQPRCLHLDELSHVLATSRNPKELLEAWTGWHAIATPMKDRYARYVELANEGAREIGFEDVGALWRSAYDMSPAELEADVERLWTDVKPLYEQLHCYVRAKLQARYGKDRVPDHAPIPADLLGNMWAQEWNNIYDLVVPYPQQPTPDVGQALKSRHWDAARMVRQGERFFTGLGFDPLPASFWQRSLFTRPRDRDVVCHASAWDVTWSDDLRIKMCIEPTEEAFLTVHHELGHDFYFQSYYRLPILFQQGANDGFHEAIGDTMALSVTPAYLETVGLMTPLGRQAGPPTDPAANDPELRRRINEQMKMALEKVAFLPFGLTIDKWRWDVFSGKVSPAEYNAAWWKLKTAYQGVSAPVDRTDADFDPGAKFHVASSTPYIRYFLARIYQFQFHRALCRAAGDNGPIDLCSIHDNKAAGEKLRAMLSLGASKPWPEALETIGAGTRAQAGPLLDYFAPLLVWLTQQNKGRTCGW